MCPGWQYRRGRESCFSKGCFLLGFPCGHHFSGVSPYGCSGHCSHLLSEVFQRIKDISERGGKILECEPSTLITVLTLSICLLVYCCTLSKHTETSLAGLILDFNTWKHRQCPKCWHQCHHCPTCHHPQLCHSLPVWCCKGETLTWEDDIKPSACWGAVSHLGRDLWLGWIWASCGVGFWGLWCIALERRLKSHCTVQHGMGEPHENP